MDKDRDRARDWWRTGIIDMSPGIIRFRGYAIEDMIGRVGYAGMVWLLLRGELPSAGQARLLEAALIASVDHGPQSPAIAIARMAITSGTDINNAMASGINVLGDVHGGAGQQCMNVLHEIAEEQDRSGAALPQAADTVLARYLEARGKHLPGFGHRFHPVDPRVAPLLGLISAAAAAGEVSGRFAAIACELEAALARSRGRPIPMNIDGVTAAVYAELGFSPELARGLFVLSRSVGILAHTWEQMQRGERIKGPTPPDFLYKYEGLPPRPMPAAS